MSVGEHRPHLGRDLEQPRIEHVAGLGGDRRHFGKAVLNQLDLYRCHSRFSVPGFGAVANLPCTAYSATGMRITTAAHDVAELEVGLRGQSLWPLWQLTQASATAVSA